MTLYKMQCRSEENAGLHTRHALCNSQLQSFELPEIRECQNDQILRAFQISEWVTQPEHPKWAKDNVKVKVAGPWWVTSYGCNGPGGPIKIRFVNGLT